MTKQDVIIVVGASGSGKTTFLTHLEELGKLDRAITSTTRDMRPGEVNGKDYHFTTKEEMFEMHDRGELCEPPNEHAGNFYGCSKAALFSDKPVGLIVDPNGANIIAENLRKDGRFNVKTVFMAPISKEEMIKRLEKRGSSEKEINSRLEIFEAESNWGERIKPNLVLRADENKGMQENFAVFTTKLESLLSQGQKKSFRLGK